MGPLLVEVVEGPDAGLQAEVTRPIVVGRSPEADVTLDDDLASREHARIWPEHDGLRIDDLGSTNGTFVNGNEVHAASLLAGDDEILIGVSVLRVRTREDATIRGSGVIAIPPALAAAPRQPTYVEPTVAAGVAELEALLDSRTKHLASVAPITLVVLLGLALVLYFGLR